MSDLAFGPTPDGVGPDEQSARIVDLAQRRQVREQAREGLVLADVRDVETSEVEQVWEGEVIDPPERADDLPSWLETMQRHLVPVVPTWLTDREQARYVARETARLAGHIMLMHTVRTPWYAVKTCWYAPMGALRAVWRAGTWASAETGNWELRQQAATRGDAGTWLALDKHRQRQSSWRWWVAGGGYLSAGAGGLVLSSEVLPWWVRLPAITGAVMGSARYGRPIDHPILQRTVIRSPYRKLSAELTRKGIMATGLVKQPEDIVFAHGDISRVGPGYLAVVDLPDGVIATDVIERREKLAGGLRLPMDQVWPETMPKQHPGCLALWVADRPVSAMKQPKPKWLVGEQTTDFFAPFTYGYDPRMREIDYRMDERNSLFAGIPGSGKSTSARVVLAAMALDPIVKFAVFDLAGRGDFDMFEPLCPAGLFGSGADEQTKQAAYRMILWLLRECDTRGPRIKKWATGGLNTENKLNRAIALRDPSLSPIVASIDEIQELITDPNLGKAAAQAATSVVKRGRALGIHLLLETQRIDKESLPKGVTSNIALRTCLAVPSHTEVDLALGTGWYKRGARPTDFEPGADSGWGVRVGYGPMTPVRAAWLDRSAVERVCHRGVGLRGGIIAGVEDLPPARDVLTDVLGALGEDPGQHWDSLAPTLADRWPESYQTTTAEVLSAMVRSLGVQSRNVKVGGSVRKGVRRADVVTVIDARSVADDESDR